MSQTMKQQNEMSIFEEYELYHIRTDGDMDESEYIYHCAMDISNIKDGFTNAINNQSYIL